MSDRCLVFIHIPKAAGSTLESAFRLRYGRSHVLAVNTLERPIDETDLLAEIRWARVKVVFGHVHYGIDEYIPKECHYATMLRDPIARILSIYKYIARTPFHPLHERFARSKIGLDEYVSSDIDKHQVENAQTRQIGNVTDRDSSVDEAALGEARRNLASMRFVGLTERFDESFVLLRRELGWRLPMYITRNAATGGRDVPVPEGVIETIRERNALDISLYRAAQKRFEADVASAGTHFQREVSALPHLNRVPDAVSRRSQPVMKKVARSRVGRMIRDRLT